MKQVITIHDTALHYELERKRVKNINLRVKPDGSVYVSANKRVPQSVIDAFILSKADFIFRALAQNEKRLAAPLHPCYSENEVRDVILALCQKVYPYFEARGVSYPQIKFRKMVSRWGSCHVKKGILTFNINLMYADAACIEYVVLHEFTHFLQANHSAKFYEELSKTCPDWNERRKRLKEIYVR